MCVGKCPPKPSKITALPTPLSPGSRQHPGSACLRSSPSRAHHQRATCPVLPTPRMQETQTTESLSIPSRSSTSTQDRSSAVGQTSSTGPQPSKPTPIIPPLVKSTGPGSGSGVRRMRRIIAEDAEWSLAIVPLLTELCIQHIVKNFQSESVPSSLGREKARSGAGWEGTAWRPGLRAGSGGSPCPLLQCPLVSFRPSVMSDSLQTGGLQHARFPCPSPSPRACSNSCPLSW